MKHQYVRCAVCGHDFPEEFVRQRGWIECSCGMRIEGRSNQARPGTSALALLLLAAAIVLLTAVAALARRLSG